MNEWNIEKTTGYKPITTFWKDFSIAEEYEGISGIKDTYERSFKEWKNDYKYITELVIVLNHKIWYWYYLKKHKIAMTYNTLWKQAKQYAEENFTGAAMDYYYENTH